MELTEMKTQLDTLGRDWAEFKRTNDERLKEIEKKGAADPLLTDKLNKIDVNMTKIEELKQKQERMELALKRRAESIETKGGAELTAEQIEHKAAFVKWARKGHGAEAVQELERKALSTDSQADGGFLVPMDITGRISERQFETSDIRPFVSVQAISLGSELSGAYDNDEADAGWVGERETRSETDTPQLGRWIIPVHEMYAKPKATQTMLDDSATNVEQWLAKKVAEKFGRKEATAFLTGTGSKQPRGMLTYTAASADAGLGEVRQVASGSSAAFVADKLFDVIDALKEKYLRNARWFLNRAGLTQIRKLKDSQNQYLFQPGLQAGAPSLLLGYAYTLWQDLPTPAANSLSAIFGDMAEFYQIVDRQGIRVLRDPFSSKPFVEFYTTKRVGGAVVNNEAAIIHKLG